MDNNILVYMLILAAIVTWLCVIAAYIIFKQEKIKLTKLLNINDIGPLRCIQAGEQINKINKYGRSYLIFIIIFTLILLLKSFARSLLFVKGDTASTFGLHDLLAVIDPIYLFSWLATLGCYVIMKQMYYNAIFIKQKCDEFKMASKNNQRRTDPSCR